VAGFVRVGRQSGVHGRGRQVLAGVESAYLDFLSFYLLHLQRREGSFVEISACDIISCSFGYIGWGLVSEPADGPCLRLDGE